MVRINFVFNGDRLQEITQGKILTHAKPYKIITADFIGKGMFCYAYRGNDGLVYLLVKQYKDDFDYSKEAIANWAHTDDSNPHIPEIKSFGQHTFKGFEYIVFRMPFYDKLEAKNTKAWADFKIIKKAFQGNFVYRPEPYFQRAHNESFDIIDTLKDGPIKDALHAILSAGSNYGQEYGIEIAKQNMGVDKDGNLILRDVLFNSKLCYIMRNDKRKKYERAY